MRFQHGIVGALNRSWPTARVLDEFDRVLKRLTFPRRLADLMRARARRRSRMLNARPSRRAVESDPQDSPILRAALCAGADYLITNDRYFMALDSYERVPIGSTNKYLRIVREFGTK